MLDLFPTTMKDWEESGVRRRRRRKEVKKKERAMLYNFFLNQGLLSLFEIKKKAEHERHICLFPLNDICTGRLLLLCKLVTLAESVIVYQSQLSIN